MCRRIAFLFLYSLMNRLLYTASSLIETRVVPVFRP